MMEIESSKQNIVVLKTDNQYELAATFLRMQEFYESPEFKDTIIDLEEYMDWYASEYGNFTYTSDWNGFNVPSGIVRRFYELHFDTLSRKERVMYELIKPWLDGADQFYVVGLWKKDNTIMEHEFSHAFFYLDSTYKKEMRALLKKVPKDFMHHCHKVLQKDGYHPVVFDDESIAYLATNTMPESADMFNTKIPWDNILPLQLAFEKRYEKYNES